MTMTCEQFDGLLPAWIEGDLDGAGRAQVDAHLRACLRCAAIVRDISAIRRDATQLPELAPSRDLWEGIAARIESPVIELAPHRPARASRRLWQVAAAAALVIASSGITYSIAMRQRNADLASPVVAGRPADVPGATASTPAAGPGASAAALVRAEPLATEVVYDREIDRLRLVLDQRRGDLDSTTVAVVEQSLKTIDRAIADARAALARDASSRFLTEQLNRALEKKLGVLRTVALIPAGAL